ncbi:importin alpha [Pelomyxa schiedti]|nr:importin alpha [Pelomyxa schiedti]
MTVPEAVVAVMSNQVEVAYQGTMALRALLSLENSPPIQEVLDSGVVPRLIQFLGLADNPKFQYEALWALTNICSGNTKQTQAVIDYGIIPPLISLLSSTAVDVVEQTAWALGNICGDNHSFRDIVLNQGFFPAILKAMCRFPQEMNFLKNATWALSNGCRGKPSPDVRFFLPVAGESLQVFPTMAALLKCPDTDVITDAAWALSYVSDNSAFIGHLIAGGVIPPLIANLAKTELNVQIPTLRALGNIATGSNVETQSLVDAGIFAAVGPLLKSKKKCLRKEACWLLSNISSGTKEQVRALFNSGLMPDVVQCLKASEMDIRKEACWVVCNALECDDPALNGYLISLGVMADLTQLLGCTDNKIVTLILEAVKRILASDKSTPNKYLSEELLAALDQLQDHSNEHIYSTALRLLEEYGEGALDDEDGGDDEDEDDKSAEKKDKKDKESKPISRTTSDTMETE